jgi:hypothetical protein
MKKSRILQKYSYRYFSERQHSEGIQFNNEAQSCGILLSLPLSGNSEMLLLTMAFCERNPTPHEIAYVIEHLFNSSFDRKKANSAD